MTVLIAAARLILMWLLGTATLVGDRGRATRFGDPGDRWAGRHLSCTHEKLKPGQMVCAHRNLPCGTVLVLHNPRTRRLAACEVLDRGPFGAILPTGEWGIKIKRDEPGTWRGILDLSPAVADALAHNGFEKVFAVHQKIARRLHVGRDAPKKAR